VTTHEGAPLKLFGASVGQGQGAPGTILGIGSDAITVACLGGAIDVAEVQPAGKKRMAATAWAQGRRITAGVVLGDAG